MIRRKDSMTALIAGKRADFQLANAFGVNAACKHRKAIAADTAASTKANYPWRTTSNIQSSAQKRRPIPPPKSRLMLWGERAAKISFQDPHGQGQQSFSATTNEDAPIKNKNRKPLISRQIHWASGTNILLAVNYQGCDLSVRN
jgi:hypothetical protein